MKYSSFDIIFCKCEPKRNSHLFSGKRSFQRSKIHQTSKHFQGYFLCEKVKLKRENQTFTLVSSFYLQERLEHLYCRFFLTGLQLFFFQTILKFKIQNIEQFFSILFIKPFETSIDIRLILLYINFKNSKFFQNFLKFNQSLLQKLNKIHEI